MSTEPEANLNPTKALVVGIGRLAPQFKALLPTEEAVQRFVRVVTTAVQEKAELVDADRDSFYTACLRAARDGLLPDGREAVLNVYSSKVGNNWIKRVQYQPMAEGMFKKVLLTGEIAGTPKVHPVYAKDEFVYELGDSERIVHRPFLGGDRGELVAAYSIVEFKDGAKSREVMSRREIDAIMARSKSKDKEGNIFGPWVSDYAEMARKTVFRRHYKRLPKSSDMDQALEADNETFEELPARPATAAPVASSAADPADGAGGQPKRSAALEHVASTLNPTINTAQKEPAVVGSGSTEDSPPADII